MKRNLLCLLLIAILLTTACGSDAGAVAETTAAPVTTAAETENDFGYVAPNVPAGTDYGGEEFCIAYCEWSNYNNYYWSDGLNGEVINDACYKRLIACEISLPGMLTTSPFAKPEELICISGSRNLIPSAVMLRMMYFLGEE